MHKEARLPLGNLPEPMRGPALVALQLLVFPHGPTDQNAVQDPEGRIQRRFVVLPIVVHPPAQDGIRFPVALEKFWAVRQHRDNDGSDVSQIEIAVTV